MRGIAISGNQAPISIPSDLLAAFRPVARAASHEFTPPLYTKDVVNFFSLSLVHLSDLAFRLCGADVGPAGIIVLDDVAVIELVDALVL